MAVVGGGPGGLHAAFKTALLYRTAVLFDAGRRNSRIYWSPRVDNLPGRMGEKGRDLIARGYQDIEQYEAEIGRSFVTIHEETRATQLEQLPDQTGWRITAESKNGPVTATARTVVLATGCIDAQPRLQEFRRRDIEAVLPYANKGLADYCLLCDGHTVEGKRVAVLGCDPGSRGIARSLKRNFGANTVVVPYCNLNEHVEGPSNPHAPWEAVQAELEAEEIPILFGHIKEFTGIKDGQFGIVFEDGTTELFDKAWISMGWYKVQNELAVQAGAAVDRDGFVRTDNDCRVQDEAGTTIRGLYAIGDLRADTWKQIPIAWGEAEVAVVDAFVKTSRVAPLA